MLGRCTADADYQSGWPMYTGYSLSIRCIGVHGYSLSVRWTGVHGCSLSVLCAGVRRIQSVCSVHQCARIQSIFTVCRCTRIQSICPVCRCKPNTVYQSGVPVCSSVIHQSVSLSVCSNDRHARPSSLPPEVRQTINHLFALQPIRLGLNESQI